MLFDIASRIGLLLLFITVLVVVWTTTTVAACVLARIKIDKISVFSGKPVFTFQTRICPLCVGYIPLGASVSRDMEDFPRRSLKARWFVILAGPLAVVLSSIACLGVEEAAGQMRSGLSQFALGTAHPFTRAAPLVARFFDVSRHSPLTAYGIFAAKGATLYILPIPIMPLGEMIIQILPKRKKDAIIRIASPLLAFLFLPLFISWAIAVVSYFWHLA